MSITQMAQEAADSSWAASFVVGLAGDDGITVRQLRQRNGWSYIETARSLILAQRYGVIRVESRGHSDVVVITDRGHDVIRRDAQRKARQAAKAVLRGRRRRPESPSAARAAGRSGPGARAGSRE